MDPHAIVDAALDTIAGGVPAHVRADYRACYDGDRFVESMRYVRRYPKELPVLAELLPQITTPVTIINGRDDRVVPFANAEFLDQRLQTAVSRSSMPATSSGKRLPAVRVDRDRGDHHRSAVVSPPEARSGKCADLGLEAPMPGIREHASWPTRRARRTLRCNTSSTAAERPTATNARRLVRLDGRLYRRIPVSRQDRLTSGGGVLG